MLQLLEELRKAGADIEASLPRFMGNEELYAKFLRKFLDDESYQSLKDALESENEEEAFKSAHTLKGVAANLGLTPILTIASEIVEEYRGGQPNNTCVEEAWLKLTAVYENICGIIKENEN